MNKKYAELIILSLILILGFIFRWMAFQQTEYANGWDAYYYLIQINSYAETGEMHSSEWNLYYPILISINFILNDPVMAVKVLSALLATLFGVSIYYLAKSLKLPIFISFFAVSLIIFSPELTYFTAQWPKNLLGLIIYILLLQAIVRKSLLSIIICLVLGYFSHRMTAVLGLMTVVIWLANNQLSLKFKVVFVLGGLLGLSLIHFSPGLFSFYDFERLNGIFSNEISYAPWEFYQLFGAEKISSWWSFELILYSFVWVGFITHLIIRLIKSQEIKSIEIAIAVVFLVLLFPFYEFTLSNIPYRFFHASLVLSPILLLFIAPDKVGLKKIYMIFTAIIIIMTGFSWRTYNPTIHDPDYKKYDQMSRKLEQYWDKNGKPELIIGHKSMAELITYKTKVDVLPWQPEYQIAEDKLYRIAYTPFKRLFEFYTNTTPFSLGSNYFYVKESDWQKFLSGIQSKENEELFLIHQDWKNPNEIRPNYLLKN
jgi:hypothetical protein